jgi:hypothetical protein
VGSQVKCRECGADRDAHLKYCGSCGQRQIRSAEAVDLFFIFWLIILALLYLVQSTYFPNGLDFSFLGLYPLIASIDAIMVVTIYLYGGKFVDRIRKAVGSQG